MPTISPAPGATAIQTPPSSAVPPPRYQVQSVLWGTRKRFVVRDVSTDTTIAIRTTSQVADSDLIRLNMGGRTSYGAAPELRPAPTDSAVEQRDRQCGRCRRFFSSGPATEGTSLQEWWLCPGCRRHLLGARPAHPE